MNQTISEGFGVGQIAGNMDIPSLNLESMKTTSQKKPVLKPPTVKKHYKGDQLKFSEYLQHIGK